MIYGDMVHRKRAHTFAQHDDDACEEAKSQIMLLATTCILLFWELFSLSSSYFYLLEGSKIFFMNSDNFIWIVRVLKCLLGFSWDFWNFLSIFGALKQLLDHLELFAHWKVISEKRKP
jgi:hypothetical protein